MKELGEAINLSLSESERIAEAVARIKSEGYDLFLVLEATIGFNKREEDGARTPTPVPACAGASCNAQPDFKINAQDLRFLKSLKISLDDAA